MLRSRSRYEDLGEKPTQYFFNLEKRNYTSKVIHKLVYEDGEEFTKIPDILNCQTSFYKDLYKEVNLENDVSINSVKFYLLKILAKSLTPLYGKTKTWEVEKYF